MFQREVAARIVAPPGNRVYGRLSVLVQWLCEARCLMHLPARAFVPPPKVASSLIQLTPRPQPLAPADKRCLERVLAAAFQQRRKMLRVEPQKPRPSGPRPCSRPQACRRRRAPSRSTSPASAAWRAATRRSAGRV